MKKRDHFRQMQLKKYSAGSYRNPYFKERKNKTIRNIPIFVAGGAIVCVIFFCYLFAYPAFAIKHVTVYGIQSVSPIVFENETNAYLNESHLFFFHNTNRFLFSKKNLSTSLSKFFTFNTLEIQRKGDTVTIHLKERTSQFIWKTGSDQYLVDLDGVIIQAIDGSVTNTLPVFSDRNNTAVTVGAHVLSADEIKNIFQFQKDLTAQNLGFKETQIDQLAGKWVGMVMNQGYTILFDPAADVDSQSARLQTLLHDTLKDTSHLQYIDLRFDDHIYYK